MGQIREINGLRGIAIISVLFEHLHLGHEPPWMHDQMPQWGALGLKFFAKSLYWNGWLAVNLFFVLSGFVLFLPYAKRQRHMASREDFRHYYVRRALRLLPLFFIVVMVSVLLVHHPFQGAWPALQEIFVVLSGAFHFTSAYFCPPSNIVLWSLGVEIWFSVLFPVIIVGAVRFGFWKTVAACMVIALATRGLSLWLPSVSLDTHIAPIKDNVFGRLDDFAAGMAVAVLYAQARFQSRTALVWSLLGGLALVWLGAIGWTMQRCLLIPDWTRVFYNLPISLGFAAIMLAAINPHLPKIIGIGLRNPFLQLAGAMCFSIYVWHYMIRDQFAPTIREPGVVFVYFFVVFVVGLLSYRFIEFGDVKDWRRLFPMFFETSQRISKNDEKAGLMPAPRPEESSPPPA